MSVEQILQKGSPTSGLALPELARRLPGVSRQLVPIIVAPGELSMILAAVPGAALDDLVKFAPVEPDAAAVRAVVNLYPGALGHHERLAIHGATHARLAISRHIQPPRAGRAS